jgi:hypothetical protein
MDEYQREQVLSLLEIWAHGHPDRNKPIMFFMREPSSDKQTPPSLTPDQFYENVREGTDLGESFLRFLARQSRRLDIRPTTFLERAIEANQGHR